MNASTEGLASVAAVAFELLKVLQGSPNAALQRWACSSLSHACRHVEYFLTPKISLAAHEKALLMGIAPLERFKWSDQPKRMKDPGRKIFHWEHMVPVSDLQAELLKLESPDVQAVEAVLRKAQVAWILKAENKRLDVAKLRYKRAKGGAAAYRHVGIRLRRQQNQTE